ncbi:MAG: hypothetical protein ACRDTF_00180 [Pseudonocardiaceae bacterium]
MATRLAATRTRALAVWVTSGAEGIEHAVTDEQMTAGQTAKTGVYNARCGTRVVAAAMVTPPQRRCTHCMILLRPGPPRHRAKPFRGSPLLDWTTRLLGLLRTPTAVPPIPGGATPRRSDGGHGGVGQHAPRQPGLAVTRHRHATVPS